MARLVQDTIRRALADELLFGQLSSGGEVALDMDDDDKLLIQIANEESKQAASV